MSSEIADASEPATVTFGIVTALEKEQVAAKSMLDGPAEKVNGAGRVYWEGTIPAKGGGRHRVVLALANQGTVSAAVCATLLAQDYPELDAVIMVGIAGAVPDVSKAEHHVRLGDIVTSGESGVVAYDFGKEYTDGFVPKQVGHKPHSGLFEAARRLAAAELEGHRPWLAHMGRAAHLAGAARPPAATDSLADSVDATCSLVHPIDPQRREGEPRVFAGTIACANRVLKNPVHRDKLREQHGVRAVEMEGFGIAEAAWAQHTSYFIVRGTCDYCDEHKADLWQVYAAVVAAAYVRALLEEMPLSVAARSRTIMREVRSSEVLREALVETARALLEAGSPPSVRALFPDCKAAVRDALLSLETTPRALTSGTLKATTLQDLLGHASLHHAIEAAPGSGKTFALWHGAQDLLANGPLVPLYIPIGRALSWEAVTKGIAALAPGGNPLALLQDPRVCVLFDGWSEFVAQEDVDTSDLWRSLVRTRLVVSRRRGSVRDARFIVWNLEQLPAAIVASALRTAYPDMAAPPPPLAELLRLPLAAALFLLLGGDALTRGELLVRLHEELAKGLPPRFRDALAGAVSAVDVVGRDRSRARFLDELEQRCARAGISDASTWLTRLGTLDVRSSIVVPLHDLYWSWLSGLGTLLEGRIDDGIRSLRMREGFDLALEGGFSPNSELINKALKIDTPLAAQLLSFQAARDAAPNVCDAVRSLIADERIAVRSRGGISGLRSNDDSLLRPALDSWSAACAQGLYDVGFENAVDLAFLFRNRGELSQWIGAPGTEELVLRPGRDDQTCATDRGMIYSGM